MEEFDIMTGKPIRSKPKREHVAQSYRKEVLALQKNKCAKCGKTLDPRDIQFDHKREVYKGGKSTIKNIQALCSSCHQIKTHDDRVKRTQKERKKPKRDSSDILGNFNAKDFNTRF